MCVASNQKFRSNTTVFLIYGASLSLHQTFEEYSWKNCAERMGTVATEIRFSNDVNLNRIVARPE